MDGLRTWMRGPRVVAAFVVLGVLFGGGAGRTDFLKYALAVTPGRLIVDRMAASGAKTYEEEFAFTVTNRREQEFTGSAPTTQNFDVELFLEGGDEKKPVWKWSAGQMFAQVVTKVSIAGGKSWTPEEKVVWSFKAADVKDGKYRAVATFVPTGNKKAVAEFLIASTR
jgi:hypothetical protein